MPNVLAAAHDYVSRGWNPVPYAPYKKAPGDPGWAERVVTDADVDRLFAGDHNIGAMLGKTSGGLTDVDLDSREATVIAPMMMPLTLSRCGRASKPLGHLLYFTTLWQSQNKAAIQFTDPDPDPSSKDKAMLLEVRCGGGNKAAQTMLPPSIHPSGEVVEWCGGVEMARQAEVIRDDEDFMRRAYWVAGACVIARRWPPVGARHEAALALGGFLVRCNFDLEHIEMFATAIAMAAGADPDGVRDTVRTSRDSAEKYLAGDRAYGFTQMKEVLGPKSARKVADWLGYSPEGPMGVVINFDRAKRARQSPVAFIRGGKDNTILTKNPQNVRFAIDSLKIGLWWDEFAGVLRVSNLPGYDGRITDGAEVRIRMMIEEEFAFYPGKELTGEVILDIALQNRRHPVRDYLDGLKWDGTLRVDHWLHTFAEAEDDKLNQAIGRIFLIAAVRRIRQPGVKFDPLITLEAPQGQNKSSALRALMPDPEWFTDSLSLEASARDVIEATRGKWVIEFGELAGLGRRDIEHIKTFLSRQVDSARVAYGRHAEEVPRQFVCAGTTNSSQYLLDDENRRFWPVSVGVMKIDAIIEERDQLWAEASLYESDGCSITLDPSLWGAAKEVQDARRIRNPYVDILSAVFDDKEQHLLGGNHGKTTPSNFKVRTVGVWDFLRIKIEMRSRESTALGRAMKELGFVHYQSRSKDSCVAFYRRGEGTEEFIMPLPKIDEEESRERNGLPPL